MVPLTVLLVITAGTCSGLLLKSVQVPPHQVSGESVELRCDYDLQDERLYAVKWYHGPNEFFRFIPFDTPKMKVFSLPGVDVNMALSDEKKVTLQSVSLESSGRYMCEVSTEAPYFQTESKAADMLVVDKKVSGSQYTPDWSSLDSRPLPQWYDDAKVGIFIHWGVFAVPSFGSEWFWQRWAGGKEDHVNFMKNNYRPGFTYQDFAPEFTAEFYDPVHWAEVFQSSGAKYVVLTSKHHEGFTLWPSKHSWSWNAMDVGPKRDLVGDLAKAIRSKSPDIHFGLYHSMFEWFNPLYLQDKKNNLTTNHFVETKSMPELYELVNNYQPEVIWSDGAQGEPDWYWNSTVFLAWLFNDSPVKDTVVVNDRWGIGDMCAHGSFYTCADRYNPGVVQPHKWENCLTLDKLSWGYRRTATFLDYMTIHELLTTLVTTVSCGGNMLINIGPTKEGTLPALMEDRLLQMGQWLSINGEAVYASKAWVHQNDTLTPGVWYTSKAEAVYAFTLEWPQSEVLTLGSIQATSATSVTMMGQGSKKLKYKNVKKGLQVALPSMSEAISQWVWVLKMENVRPRRNTIN